MNQLSIAKYRTKLLKAIQNNRVVVISGRTGCGKSTQVPKYILQEYPKANIAICQPRRLVANSLACRVSEQLNCPIGDIVGYHIGMLSKVSNQTRITYMTYGILIQQLLFNSKIEYTHIILDQVHQRSLEMDFTFIALKKILDCQQKKDTKVVIMSATINSQKFAQHFSTHIQTKQFLKPTITYKVIPQKNRTSCNSRKQRLQQIVQIQFQKSKYLKAQSIQIADKSNYTVIQYYADQIEDNKIIPQYLINQDIRIRDDTYKLAAYLIKQQLLKNKDGDILIFVPGMVQIKTLKQLLLVQGKTLPQQIVQVHSAYSEQLYDKLFKSKIKQKIIIATNIGESSITLPFCKTVIDFCLTRKNITVKMKGYSRFQTQVASKANLMQRAGRVGRLSDGEVYRLISRNLYDKLDYFDKPQIQCVSLDMAILRAKKIDQTYKSTMFQDLYQVFFNAIQPPQFRQIHSAIQYLIDQQALQFKGDNTNNNKFSGTDLKITLLGQFMVSMPCSIRISKMIILSIEVGIVSIMVDVAAILLTQKSFFLHEEKRQNIEEFMHSMVGYDNQNYNDFLLRQRLFNHWKQIFFYPFLKQNYPYKQKNKPQSCLMQKILQQYNSQPIFHNQWNWCNERGVSPWVMRDILRISQNIKQRLQNQKIYIPKIKQQINNQLVILCLCIAFQDTTCQLQWKLRNASKNRNQIQNYVSIIESKQTTIENIDQFMKPLPPPDLLKQQGGFIKVKSSYGAYSKLLLPRYYTKANIKNTSPLYRYLASNPPKASYTYQPATVRQRIRQVTILNDSINKVNIKLNHFQQYMLVSDKIFDSKGKYYMGASALIEKKKLILIKMMTAKSVQLIPHVSRQFYESTVINHDNIQIPFILTDSDVDTILQFRRFNEQDKWSQNLDEGKKFKNTKKIKFEKLLSSIKPKPKIQQWTYIYNLTIQKYLKHQQNSIDISELSPLIKITQGHSYFQRYHRWKQQQHKQMYLNFRLLTIKNTIIICSKCWPSYLTVIEDVQAFCTQTKKLKLNEYRGSWVSNNNYLQCARKHKIGVIQNPDQGQIQYQNVLLYSPLKQTNKFDGDADTIRSMQEKVQQGIKQIQRQKSKIWEFECKICSTYDDYDKLKRIVLVKVEETTNSFWKRISDHMYSSLHLKQLEQFLATL